MEISTKILLIILVVVVVVFAFIYFRCNLPTLTKEGKQSGGFWNIMNITQDDFNHFYAATHYRGAKLQATGRMEEWDADPIVARIKQGLESSLNTVIHHMVSITISGIKCVYVQTGEGISIPVTFDGSRLVIPNEWDQVARCVYYKLPVD